MRPLILPAETANADYTTDTGRRFAPNIGLAWDPFGDGKTAVRAGFSINYVNDEFFTAADNAAAGNTGLSVTPQNTGTGWAHGNESDAGRML